jgi:hypothetical protein
MTSFSSRLLIYRGLSFQSMEARQQMCDRIREQGMCVRHDRVHCWSSDEMVAMEFSACGPFGLVLCADIGDRRCQQRLLLDSDSEVGRTLWPTFRMYGGTEYFMMPCADFPILCWQTLDR